MPILIEKIPPASFGICETELREEHYRSGTISVEDKSHGSA